MRSRLFFLSLILLNACGGDGNPCAGTTCTDKAPGTDHTDAPGDLGSGKPGEANAPADMNGPAGTSSDMLSSGDLAKTDWCAALDCDFSFTDCACSVTMGSVSYTFRCTSGIDSASCGCTVTGANEPQPTVQPGLFACSTLADHRQEALAACGARPQTCGSACVDLNSDPANCGACGNVCNPQQSCTSGACQCPNGGMLCNGACTDITTLTDCGACGNVCSGTAAHGAPACQAGSCTIACETGYTLSGGACTPGWTSQGPDGSTTLYGVWGTGPDNVYVVGQAGTVFHSKGDGNWSSENADSSYDLMGIWGSSGSDIYLVGFAEAGDPARGVLHSRMVQSTGATIWSAQVTGVNLMGVWGSGPGDVYAVGAGGAILHSTGDGTWTPQNSGTSNLLRAIWGSGPNDVYAVGDGQILHSTGNGVWTAYKGNLSLGGVCAVWGSSATDIYAVGGGTSILHSTGSGNWTLQTAPFISTFSSGALQGVWGSGAGDVYTVGWYEMLARTTGNGTWYLEDARAPYQPTLYAIWGSSGGIYTVGSDNTILYKAAN